MHPEICKIGFFTVYSYGLLLVIAFMVSSTLSIIEAKKQNINPEVIFNLLFVGFIFGVIGARIFYVIQNFNYFFENPYEIIMLQHGGLSWFGGLILGVFSAILYIRSKKLSVYKVFDLVIPFVALAQAIGRVGCLLNGCCYGKVSEKFGIYFEVHNASLLPTQIYSSLLLVLIYIILRFLQDRPHRVGQIFFSYLLLYSLKRFFIEYWRDDNSVIFACLTLFQALSIVTFVIAVINLLLLRKGPNSSAY
ncbi:MAG: prolipoprotein diacylglyceryl transferase [Candidatus Omnitrophota bacterium]